MSDSDLKKYITERKKKDAKFAEGYDEGYEQFMVGVMLCQARESAGITNEQT
jgi:hypothetical protein